MKRLAILTVVLTLLLFTLPATQAASISDIQFFPSDYVWNVPIDTMPVHPMSDTYIAHSYPNSYMYIIAGSPINIVDSNTPKQFLTSMAFGEDLAYPIPNDAEIYQGYGESSMFIVDQDSNYLYEFYCPVQAADGSWSARGAFGFDLSDYSLKPENRVTISISGTPQTQSYIKYEEVASGSINHATNLFLYTSGKSHIWPARMDGLQNSDSYPPLGQRFRLKASFDTSGYSPHAKTILNAWKKYGLILTDNSGSKEAWQVSADGDPRWDTEGSDINYATFGNLQGSDFEAVDESSLMINKDSGQARRTPSIIPTQTPA